MCLIGCRDVLNSLLKYKYRWRFKFGWVKILQNRNEGQITSKIWGSHSNKYEDRECGRYSPVFQRSLPCPSSTFKTEAGSTYKSTWNYKPEGQPGHLHHHENLDSYVTGIDTSEFSFTDADSPLYNVPQTISMCAFGCATNIKVILQVLPSTAHKQWLYMAVHIPWTITNIWYITSLCTPMKINQERLNLVA